MALLLVDKGLSNVSALRGGLNAWQTAGFDVVSGAKAE